MNARETGYDSRSAPPDPPADGPRERDAAAPVQAAPADADNEDRHAEDPAEEPGYGHGV